MSFRDQIEQFRGSEHCANQNGHWPAKVTCLQPPADGRRTEPENHHDLPIISRGGAGAGATSSLPFNDNDNNHSSHGAQDYGAGQ